MPSDSVPAPRVAVLLPMVWSVRNVVTSGVLEALARSGVDCRLILRGRPRPSDTGAPEAMASAGGILDLLKASVRPMLGTALLDGVRTSSFARRRRIGSYGLYRRWFARHDGMARRLRSGLTECAGSVVAGAGLDSDLGRFIERRYRASHDLQPIRKQLTSLSPDVLWSTVCVAPLEYGYVLAARDLGLPVVTSILSFDNLTSRSEIPRFDRYLVWSERMRDQLRRLYPHIPAEAVVVTGTPQFDFHARADCRWPREVLLERLNLPRTARYFLYAGSHESLTPEEPALVAAVLRRMESDDSLRDMHLVVRLHPLDDPIRWNAALARSDRAVLTTAWDSRPEPDGWTFPTPDDMARLISTILYSEACLNVASTMSLDAALLDRPVLGLDLRSEPDSPQDVFYEEYGADHYRPLVESGGLRVARSWNDLLEGMREAVLHPERGRAERARMATGECGLVDGRAAQRVAAELAAFTRSHTRRLRARLA